MTSASRYCPRCGHRLTERHIENRTRKYCLTCETPRYRNPKPCAGVLVVDRADLLLIKRARPPHAGVWAVPAGYLEADEPAKTAAVRELTEETGLVTEEADLELLDTAFVNHEGDHNVIVIIYTVENSETSGATSAGSDAAAVRFWTLKSLDTGGERIEPGYRSILETAVSYWSDE